MKLKVITGILLILLLTNIITTLNVTSVFAFVNNSSKTENTAGDLLKNVNFNETLKDAVNSTNTGYSNFWDFGGKNQTNAKLGYWGTNSTEVVVGLADTEGAYAKVEQLALMRNGKIVNKVLIGGRVEAAVIDVPGDSVASFVTEVKENGLSKYVEPNSKYQAYMVPNDTYWNIQWGPKKIQADYAWNTTTGSKTVLVCVIDTGIDYNHPDLAANYAPGGYDWVNNDIDPMDDNGHGTHCSGIIGAEINNGIGIAGLAQVRIMAEKGLDAYGFGYESTLANAIIDATDKGAKIISMSWGGSSPSTLIHDALKYAYDHGVLLVAAAGNSGSSQKSYPAAYDEVIAVTATDQNDAPAYFTSYGDWVELAAPGVGIYSTTPTYHVTLNDQGVAMNYDYLSGTSMACPHVSGGAALVWSEFPNMSRDVLRFHLRDTADDLGTPGFDIYYGYGRVNARRAITEPLPPHDIVIGSWEKPPYVEPNSTGTINATILNYGRSDEANVAAELIINGSIMQSSFVNITSGTSKTFKFSWTPTQIGNYNVTVYVPPVGGETNTKNNIVQGYVYVGIPLRIFVLRSYGTQSGGVTDAWQALNYNWKKFGNRLISIDYTTLDKNNITYEDLNATRADVLIISCAWQWEYSDAEIAAIKKYVYEGHGFIATAGTFYYQVPNNNKLASMLGLNESEIWGESSTDLLELLDPSHPLFVGVPNPYTMPSVGTAVPSGGIWTKNELAGGKYVAMGYYNESAIVVYQGLVYISPWLEAIPERYNFNLQILYNAMTWSKFQRPEHELAVSLNAPPFLFLNCNFLLNATIVNQGSQNESNVKFFLSVYDITHDKSVCYLSQTIPLLRSSESYTLNFSWNPTLQGVYNATAYAPPVPGEANVGNNKVTVLVNVMSPLISPQEGQWARYSEYAIGNSTGQQVLLVKLQLDYSKYISLYEMNVTLQSIAYAQGNATAWTVVNIFNRLCESGAWNGLWFPGMIQTNIALGSTVNLLGGQATVIGSETLAFGTKVVDTWRLNQTYMGANYTYWYDKTDGLWMKLEFIYGSTHEIIMLDDTNIPTGYTPAHELRVALEAPSLIWLGNSSMLNATVFNYGLNNETNVQLVLKIDGIIVKSLSVPMLAVNDSSTTSYPWTPPNEAVYNVTAYAQPVLGEDLTSDNIAIVFVKVVTIKGRVLFDQTHLADSASSYSVWIDNVRTAGYIVDLHLNGSITSDVLAGYDAFVTINPGHYYSPQEFSAITGFVAKGGGLLVVGDDQPSVCWRLTGFAGIYWTYGGTPGLTTDITPHEVTEGVGTVFLLDPNAMIYPSPAQALVRDYSGNIMLAVNWYEGGRVMGFTDQDSLRDYAVGSVDNLRLATNMIAWLCEKDTTPPQMLLIAPSNGTIIRTASVTINWTATDSQSGIDKYSIYSNSHFVANTTLESYTLSSLTNGSNNITIVAYDKAGNSASVQVTIIVARPVTSVEGLVGTTGYKLVFKETMSNTLGSPALIDYYWSFSVDKWDGTQWVASGISGSSAPVVGYVIPGLTAVDLPYYVYLLDSSTVKWGDWLKISFTFHWTYGSTDYSTDYMAKLHVHPGDIYGATSIIFPYPGADGFCNFKDFTPIQLNWLKAVSPGTDPASMLARADINGDGIVNLLDINPIAFKWQKTWTNTPPP